MFAPAPVKSAPDAPVVLSIDGTVAPLRLTPEAIATLPRTVVTWTVHGKKMTCEGPWLTDVLARAGVPSGEAIRGKLLSTIVVATGRDSYSAAFTIGELDHMLGNAPVIVADRCNGAALADADGPVRLVAADDRRGARSVRQLDRLTIVEVPESSSPR